MDDVSHEIAGTCIAVRVRMLNRTITGLFDTALRPAGLSTAQLNLLVAIAGHGPLRAAVLGRTLMLEKSSLSRDLRPLRRAGWIEDAGPGRGRELRITPAGQDKIREVYPRWQQAQAQAAVLLGRVGVASVSAAAEQAAGWVQKL
jgi:DNA-binding MarR family transcriptional regulator